MKTFAIYGDNIVECERMLALLQRSLHSSRCSVAGAAPAPTFWMDTPSGQYEFHCYPGFCRWEHDIISSMRQAGGILRETPDVFITVVKDTKETPILAVEFCSALPAGNQAWQRNGRAYSTARCGIPYLFVTEIGGYELNANREKKSRRLPNPAIPFSYISYAIGSRVDMMIAYEMNPGADDDNRAKYTHEIAGEDLLRFIAAKITSPDSSAMLSSMIDKVFSFVCAAADERRSRVPSLNSIQWQAVYRSFLHEKSATALYRDFHLPWKKKLSIDIKNSFKNFLSSVEDFAIAVSSGDLPFCIVRNTSLGQLKTILHQVYPRLFDLVSESDIGQSDMAICWINGFKPRGDDARPDRGLLPLIRMLFGDTIKILTLVYGPATPQLAQKLKDSPQLLANENGLWEAILALSNFVICDSMRIDSYVCQKGWGDRLSSPTGTTSVVVPANTKHFPVDSCIGENDVDSVIHMLFAYLLKGKCFESMCNPPGGDWSGISLLSNQKEYRWLTLPRVSATGSKRPDHVIQINENLVLTIESKDYLRNLENDIGERLNQYCIDLFSSAPSCVRNIGGEWSDHVDGFLLPEISYVSAAAFIETAYSDRNIALSHAKTDLILLVSFSNEVSTIRIKFGRNCNTTIRNLLSQIQVPDGLKVKVELLD